MAKKETKKLEYFTDWKYAPAPEATDHIKLQKQYELFINGKFVKPSSGKYFDTINPATEEKIISRFQKSIDNAIKMKPLAKRFFVIDNSQENNPVSLLELENNRKTNYINKTFYPTMFNGDNNQKAA